MSKMVIANTNDGSDAAPRLRLFTSMGCVRSPGTPGDTDDALYAAIKEVGYEGVQGGKPEMNEKYGLASAGSGRINEVGEAAELIKRERDAGRFCATLHVAWGLEGDDEVDAIVNESVNQDFPLYIETHRATLTDDMWRTVQLAKRHPGVRFNGDFSHWYTGHEMVYGGMDMKCDFLEPVFERVRFMHGRIGNPGCMQVDVGDGSGGDGFEFVDHFREMWTRSMVGFLRDARPGDFLVFAPELIGAGAYYARLFPDGEGGWGEETNRWEQSLVLCRIARDAWQEAERRVR